MRRWGLSLLSVAVVFLAVLSGPSLQMSTAFERSTLTIRTESGSHKFDVELAVTPEELSFGLMHRRSLAANAGMLFDYSRPQKVAMWMKNTLIPLDMVFIDATGTVAHISERAVPQSLRTISSRVLVRAVLELNGGTVARLKIKIGDRIQHTIFGG
jgi:uncharacterized membrane protein (UPF0127 family)